MAFVSLGEDDIVTKSDFENARKISSAEGSVGAGDKVPFHID